jgi:hypothetical protein
MNEKSNFEIDFIELNDFFFLFDVTFLLYNMV